MSKEKILITGATGSLGHALVPHFLREGQSVRVFSRDERKQLEMRKRFPDVEFQLGDVRDAGAVKDAVRDVDIVIHAASLKYVDVSEKQPREYVLTNTVGTLNVLDAVLAGANVRRCVGISSDKAVRSVNCYGLTKGILERLFLEAQTRQGKGQGIEFTVARYGNCFGTRGSVVPYWATLRARNEPLPLTDGSMTRFLFTLEEAVRLVNLALEVPGGIIVSTEMSACQLQQLAEVMASEAGIRNVGRRPGEKLHEELLTAEEMARTVKQGKYFLYDPQRSYNERHLEPYTSNMSSELLPVQIREMLHEWISGPHAELEVDAAVRSQLSRAWGLV